MQIRETLLFLTPKNTDAIDMAKKRKSLITLGSPEYLPQRKKDRRIAPPVQYVLILLIVRPQLNLLHLLHLGFEQLELL